MTRIPAIKVHLLPKDTNALGTIFGGVILSHIDLASAVEARKHVFIEKPVAVDPPGCRRVIAAGRQAQKKGLVVLAGTEMRHEWNHIRTHQAVAVEKMLGKLYAGRVSFCIAHMFHTKPINPQTG